MTHIDTELLKWATPRQAEILNSLNETGSAKETARLLGVNASLPGKTMERLKAKAAVAGYSPDHDMKHTVPEGFSVRGVSTYYDSDGKPRAQWVKSRSDDVAREAAMRAAYEAMASELPRLPASAGPETTNKDLCNLYTITDAHVGALCWHREGGDDWDLKIAEETLVGAFRHMIESSPSAEVAVVNQLGDFMHADSVLPMTPTSGHVLDTDGRFSKAVGVAIRILRQMIDMALAKHDRVHVIMATGNHDISSSIWLRLMFTALYENEPRVTVNDSELPFYAFHHGKVMLAFHHGHTKKNESLPLMFATQYSEMWGLSDYRYAHCGHRHHSDEKEHSGMKVVQHSTLAARDAYAARGGWHSIRQAIAITYHAEYGEVARSTVTPGMLR